MTMVATSEDLDLVQKDMDVKESEKVEMKDVPNGEHPTAVVDEKPSEEANKAEAAKQPKGDKTSSKLLIKGFFSRGKSGERKAAGPPAETPEKAVDAAEEDATELLIKTDDNGDVTVQKPKRQGFRVKLRNKLGKPKSTGSKKEPLPSERDSRPINPDVALSFEDLIGEAEGQHSADCNWRAARWILTRGRGLCYTTLSMPFVIPLALLYALVFALLTCLQVWLVRPAGIGLKLVLGWLAGAWAFLVRGFLDPFFMSCGLCFKQYKKAKTDDTTIEIA